MSSQSDTEALKALVALARKLPKLPFAERDGVQNADFAMATVKALPALERMLASQTQDMVLVPRKLPDEAIQRGLPSWVWNQCLDVLLSLNICAAPVASQMGEPFGWLRANGHFERGTELISKHPQDAGGAIPLYAAPAAGMDADSSPPLAESVGALLDEEVKATLKSMVEALTYAEASLGAVQATMNLRGDLKGSALMQTALDKVRDALHSRHMQQGK